MRTTSRPAPRPAPPRGFTLIEALAAMGVLLIGTLGLVALHRVAGQTNADSRVMTRATALAQDLVTQMQMWSFADPRLTDATTSNNGDFADGAGVFFQGAADASVYDHQEAELEPLPNSTFTWLGTPTATAQAMGFTRAWNVADVDLDENGALNAKRVAVIVRWQRPDGARRRVVLVTAIRNPAVTN